MAKKSIKNKKKTNNKKKISIPENKIEISKIIKYSVVVLLCLVGVYLLTIYITTNSTDAVKKLAINNTTIQYDEILAGTSFDQKPDDYIVLFYNSIEDKDNQYIKLRSEYALKEDSVNIYYVDLNNALNKWCVSTSDNSEVDNVQDLNISSPTLIRFVDHQVSDYITGYEDIAAYLS